MKHTGIPVLIPLLATGLMLAVLVGHWKESEGASLEQARSGQCYHLR